MPESMLRLLVSWISSAAEAESSLFQWLNYEIYFERDVTVQYSCWMDLSAPQYICPSLVPAQHRDYLELARPALFFSHPMALGGHQDQNEYSCKSPAAALLYSNGYCWGCCYGCRKRVEIQVQKSLLLTATFLIMERCSTTSWTTMKQNSERLELHTIASMHIIESSFSFQQRISSLSAKLYYVSLSMETE